MNVRIGGQEYELEPVMIGHVPACRLKRRGGGPLTTTDFAAMPDAHRRALLALIGEQIEFADAGGD